MTYSYCPQCGESLATTTHEGDQRLACPDEECGFVHFDNPTPVVAAIVERDGRVVLVQNEEWPDDWYALVSGFLESGEGPEEGMLREIREEIHLEADIQSLVGVYPFEMMNQLLVVYHVTVDGEPEVGDELSDLREVPIDEVEPWEAGTGPALAEWLEER
jgi:NADH pyrophosphatase NudC (nudix superfamily)